jgi:hypothetical protein
MAMLCDIEARKQILLAKVVAMLTPEEKRKVLAMAEIMLFQREIEKRAMVLAGTDGGKSCSK